jgi:hypothetical protein
MTEQEAKTKWCPFVRAPHLGTAGINRQVDEQPTPQARCIGSACMGWRWAGAWDANHGGFLNDSTDIRERTVAGRLMEHEKAVGYCGLAGKP